MIKRDLDFSRNPTKTRMVISIVRASKLETSHWLSLRALEALQKEGCWSVWLLEEADASKEELNKI